jgi:hypothetical protein
MFEILDDWKLILDILIAAPVAWQSPADIAAALGRGVDETTDVLSVMDEADWLTVWEVEPGPLITLSALAAHRLKVVLVEEGPEETPRWARANQPIAEPARASNAAVLDERAGLDRLPDSEPSAEHAAEYFERRSARFVARRLSPSVPFEVDDLPLPILLLGQNLTPWPGPQVLTRADVCPACAGAPLGPYAYCLGCDRWGLDEVLERLAPVRRKARRRGANGSWISTRNETAAPVGKPSPARPGRKDGRPQSNDQVSRNRVRREVARPARGSAAVEQR